MGEETGGVSVAGANENQLFQLHLAFKYPRGQYGVERASQLSGVPSRTLHDWARVGVYVPDFNHVSPKMWSYRDLVFVRLFAWLRAKRMDRSAVAMRVLSIKGRLATEDSPSWLIRSDGVSLFAEGAKVDDLSGQQVLAGMTFFLDAFDLSAPVDSKEFKHVTRLWGPNLVKPSARTSISPWIMGGDPCLAATRIPTVGIYSLAKSRGLGADRIAGLYEVDQEAIEDAIGLEERLHRAA